MNDKKRFYRPLLYKANVVWTSSEEVIVNYFNSYKNKVFILNQKQLAIETHTSESTVSRFCKKIGFDSYKNFVFYLNQLLLEFNQEYPIVSHGSKNKINNLLSKNFFAIKNTLNLNTMQKIKKVSGLIAKSKRTIVFGYEFSQRIAEELTNNLLKIGLNVIWTYDIKSIISIISAEQSKEVYVIFFNKTKEKEIMFLLEEIKKNSGISILISSNEFKTLNKNTSIVIKYEKIKEENELVPIASKISQTLIADAIFEMILEKKPLFKNKILKRNLMIKRMEKV